MTDSEPALPPELSRRALFRYLRTSEVLARMHGGQPQAEAVCAVAAREHIAADGSPCRVSTRSLYRWLAAYRHRGWAGLQPRSRTASLASSAVPSDVLSFAAEEKEKDPATSIPELILRARRRGLLSPDQPLDRTTVYRALKRRGVCVQRRRSPTQRDSRRFAYAHRMEMVLADGKHFRAGARRARRVAFFFLDDATRMGLEVIVGPSESSALFLQGLYRLVCRYGFAGILYLDHGSGFIAHDTVAVVAKFPTLLVHGRTAYPQGHGKIERFNRTALNRVLRGLDRRPDVDPECGALTLRLSHWMRQDYNHTPHESLAFAPPAQRFEADPQPLCFPENLQDLNHRFTLHLRRRVSNDHVVSVDSTAYEVPRGYAGARILLQRRLLEGTIHLLHQGKQIELHPVQPTFNAESPRARPGRNADPADAPLPPSAADLAFDRDHRPLVGSDGGFPDPSPPQDPSPETLP